MTRGGRLAAALAGAALLAACGGDSISVEDDRESVERAIAVFEASLAEDGFEASEEEAEDDDDDFEFRTAECERFEALNDDDLPGSSADAESDELERGEVTAEGGTSNTAQASVGLVREPDGLDEYVGLLRDEGLEPCFEEAIRVSFETEEFEGLTLAELRVSRPGAPQVGDETVRIRVDGALEVEGAQVPFVFLFDFARDGRAAALVSTTTINAEEPSFDPEPLLRLLIDEVA
ncbi:MAG: hypothetical protein ACRD0N_07065 [Acidimicrobiales bacterium]